MNIGNDQYHTLNRLLFPITIMINVYYGVLDVKNSLKIKALCMGILAIGLSVSLKAYDRGWLIIAA